MDLLTITAGIHNIEFEAERIMEDKAYLAQRKTRAIRNYNDALTEQTLTYQTKDGQQIPATFNNLCGLTSIGSNIATGANKRYVFRTSSDDKLIVPADIYQSYEKYCGSNTSGDPYEFAMYMSGVDINSKTSTYQGEVMTPYDKALNEFMDNCENRKSAYDFAEQKKNMITLVTSLYNASTVNQKDESGKSKEGSIEHIVDQLIATGNIDDVKGNFTDIPSNMQNDFTKLEALVTKYRHEMFRQGAADIYSAATGAPREEFDNDQFNYYLYWGKLIQQEEGLGGCIDSDDYQFEDFENNADTLNKMIMYGQITIDIVEDNTETGEVKDEMTTPFSDSILNFTEKSKVDSSAVRKAEAEYQKTMAEINEEETEMDMELQQLETLRNALTTEYDTVKQFVDDNIKRSFKIFS
jgi:hypothetical protein